MREIDLYKIGNTPEELQSALKSLRADFDSHIHDGSSSRTFQTLTAETISSRVMLIRKTSYTDNASGIWMGLIGNTMALKLGDGTSNFGWDGSNLTVVGGTITGGVIRTAASGARVQLDSSYLRVFNSSGVEISSILATDGGNTSIFGVRLQTYDASDLSTGFFCSVKKGNCMAGFSTGVSAYSVSASATGYSASYTPNDTNGNATVFLEASSVNYAALDVNGGTWLHGALAVMLDTVLVGGLGVGGGAFFDADMQIDGSLQVNTDLNVLGTKAGVIDTEDFGRLTYVANESPTAVFSDSGESILSGKNVKISIDPKFKASVEDDDKYLVFVTPLADIGSFRVERQKGSFTVFAERDGAFAWEIKAVRKGYRKFRFGYLDGFEKRKKAEGNIHKRGVVR
jgi:hypothetical protein